ncbi:MAG: MFS transporter [Chthonomonadaceae bacterium]|nr:MFS transporter [Chthonomonadaceae bacterium]
MSVKESNSRGSFGVGEGTGIKTPAEKRDYQRILYLIGMGLFITTIGQPKVIGRLPFNFMLKDELHFNAQQVASFWALSNFFWYFKPLAGLLCDSVPIFGTRRRWYLILAAAGSAISWTMFAFLPRTYNAFLGNMLVLSGLMVIASTVVGGILVEQGQKYKATGRITSLRLGLDGVISLIVGPLGGYLASRAFGLTVGIAVMLLLSLIPVAFFFLHEPSTAQRNSDVWRDAARQLGVSLRTPTMWWGTLTLFLFYLSPSLGDTMNFYQSDVLHFSKQFIGNLEMASGIGGIVGALLYGVLCRKIPLRTLLVIGISVNAISTLSYLAYKTAPLAIFIDLTNGFFSTFAVLPLFDLAARATPKGSESFGYALMMSVRNLTLFAISAPLGAYIYEHSGHSINSAILISAGTTALVLLIVPLLPRVMMSQRDGD